MELCSCGTGYIQVDIGPHYGNNRRFCRECHRTLWSINVLRILDTKHLWGYTIATIDSSSLPARIHGDTSTPIDHFVGFRSNWDFGKAPGENNWDWHLIGTREVNDGRDFELLYAHKSARLDHVAWALSQGDKNGRPKWVYPSDRISVEDGEWGDTYLSIVSRHYNLYKHVLPKLNRLFGRKRVDYISPNKLRELEEMQRSFFGW